MGYLLLLFALLSGAVKGFCGKKLGGYATNLQSAVLLNLIRMLLCVALGFTVLFLTGDFEHFTINSKVLFVSALSGISTSFFVVSWLLSVRKSAYMMLDVFLMMGTLIPMLAGYFLFSEPVSIRQWIGFVILVIAALIMCSYNNSIKTKLSFSSILLLIACGFSNGITDFSQKLYVKSFPNLPVSMFNLYTYIFAAVTLAIFFVFRIRKEKIHFDGRESKVSFLIIFVMAVALTANSQFKTMAASHLNSAQLYPMNQGAALVLSTLMANFFFKEKFTFKAFVGILLAFVALILMNL